MSVLFISFSVENYTDIAMLLCSTGVLFSPCFHSLLKYRNVLNFPFPISKCHVVVIPVRAEFLTEVRPFFARISPNSNTGVLLNIVYSSFWLVSL